MESQTARSHIITAIYIMDEKSFGLPRNEGNLIALSQKYWEHLRSELIDALFLFDEAE